MKRNVPVLCMIVVLLSVAFIVESARASRELAVTVYNQDFAVIKDVRVIEINRKTNQAVLEDISASIDPTSVQISSLDNSKFSVLEQNFEYDLLNTNKLLERMKDKTVCVVLDDGRLFEGRLLAVDSGQICIRDNNGGIKIINKNRHFYQIRLSELPKGLRLRPTLIWKISNGGKSKEKVEIAYQTSKFSWRADYNVTLNRVNRTLSMNGWVTITNSSGSSFPDAHLKLVAGEVHKVKEQENKLEEDRAILFAAKAAAAPPGFEERSFSEYHLYDLGRKTTLANNETKQIELFDISNVKYQVEYVFENMRMGLPYRWSKRYSETANSEQGTPLSVSIAFENEKKNHLGIPLPAGKVRLYQRDTENVEHLIGQDEIEHTPKDETVRLRIGKAFDVLGSRKILKRTRISDYESTEDILIRVRNHKNIDIPVIVRDKLEGWRNWAIENNNVEYKKTDYRTIEFKFELKANSEQKIIYRVHYKRYNW